ncbi:hypothetical protein BDV59DRAFT_178930 [Aspergillus ambiguus]|uniref:putative C2H2 zinc finger domain protein n=1 Tax=Aspergillus ambiguus TaxID=176160 RepID=UPI003CCDDF2B
MDEPDSPWVFQQFTHLDTMECDSWDPQGPGQLPHVPLQPNPAAPGQSLGAPIIGHMPPTPVGSVSQSTPRNMPGAQEMTAPQVIAGNYDAIISQAISNPELTAFSAQSASHAMREDTTALEEEAALRGQMAWLKKVMREYIPRIPPDRLSGIRNTFRQDFRDIELLFSKYTVNNGLSPPSDISSPATPLTAHNNGRKDHGKNYRCCLCNNGKLLNRGTFRRHFTNSHTSDRVYVCFCDNKQQHRRRDKINEHLQKRHYHGKPPREDVDRLAIRAEGPFQCEFCTLWYATWEEMWVCIQTHSDVTSNPSQTPNGGNGGNGPGDNSDFGGPSGAGGSGWYGSQFPGSPGSFPSSSQHGYGTSANYHMYQRQNTYRSASSHSCESLAEDPESAAEDADTEPSDSSCSHSPCEGDDIDMTAGSSTGPVDHHELRSRLEKVPPHPQENESTLTHALRGSPWHGLFDPDQLDPLGLIPKKPGQDRRSPENEPSGSCKTCGHPFEGCRTCQKQKQLGDRCHACADKTCSLPRPVPLRLEIPQNPILSREVSSPSSGYSQTSEQDIFAFDDSDTDNKDTASAHDLADKPEPHTALESCGHKPTSLDYFKSYGGNDHSSDLSLSLRAHSSSDSKAESWSLSIRTRTTEYAGPSKNRELTSKDICFKENALSYRGRDGVLTVTAWEIRMSCSMNRSLMRSDPGLSIMLPFLGFLDLGLKPNVFTKGPNLISNFALQRTSFIAQQMQNQHHDKRLLHDAASTAAQAVLRNRSGRLRKKLQAVAHVLARFASVTNAAPATVDTQEVTSVDGLDSKSANQPSDLVRAGDNSGFDPEALLERVGEIMSFLGAGMTETFGSPQYTFSSCDNDYDDDVDDDNVMRCVMAFFWQFLIALLQIQKGPLITTDVVACG